MSTTGLCPSSTFVRNSDSAQSDVSTDSTDAAGGRSRPLLIADIQRAIAAHFGVPATEMVSDRRHRQVARPRQVAMYIARHATPHSLPQIGRAFRRDHTTVMHAIAQIEALMVADAEFDAEVRALTFAFTPAAGPVS